MVIPLLAKEDLTPMLTHSSYDARADALLEKLKWLSLKLLNERRRPCL